MSESSKIGNVYYDEMLKRFIDLLVTYDVHHHTYYSYYLAEASPERLQEIARLLENCMPAKPARQANTSGAPAILEGYDTTKTN